MDDDNIGLLAGGEGADALLFAEELGAVEGLYSDGFKSWGKLTGRLR